MAETLAPHRAHGEYSPLSDLILKGLARFGESSPSSVLPDVQSMMVDFANEIVMDVNQHPYHPTPRIEFYQSANEVRSIPDVAMVAGLAFKYSLQQASEKTSYLSALYYRTLAHALFDQKYGNAKITMEPTDGGSNPYYRPETLNGINGRD